MDSRLPNIHVCFGILDLDDLDEFWLVIILARKSQQTVKISHLDQVFMIVTACEPTDIIIFPF